MLCCLCKTRNAKVHIKQFIGNEQTEANLAAKIDLCEDCAKKHGVNDPAGFSLADLLAVVKNTDCA